MVRVRLEGLPDEVQRIADAMRGMGIDLQLGTPLTGIEPGDDGWVTAVVTPEADRRLRTSSRSASSRVQSAL